MILKIIFYIFPLASHDEEHLLERVLANDIKAVSKLIGLELVWEKKIFGKEGQVKKKRRLEPEEPMDPSFDDNLLLFEALSHKLPDMVSLLMSHTRVQETVIMHELVQSAIEHHFNGLAFEYLKHSDLCHFQWHFTKALLSNNLPVLLVLSGEGRVDLTMLIKRALPELSVEHQCEGTVLFLLDHEFCDNSDKVYLLDWACYNWSIRAMIKIFSDATLCIDIDRARQSLLGGGTEMVILMMAQPGADIDAIKDDLFWGGFNVHIVAEHMKRCLEADPLEIIVDSPKDGLVYGAMLAIACFHMDTIKVKSLIGLGTDLKLGGDMVCILVSAMAAKGHVDILRLLIQHNLTTLTTSGLDSLLYGHRSVVHVVFSAFCQMDPEFGELQAKIRAGDGKLEGQETIAWLNRLANGYRAQEMGGLAGLVEMIKAHYIAMAAIAARPTYLPPEIMDHILSHSFPNLPSYR